MAANQRVGEVSEGLAPGTPVLIAEAMGTTVTGAVARTAVASGGKRTIARGRTPGAGTTTEVAVTAEAVTQAGVTIARTGGMARVEGTGMVRG